MDLELRHLRQLVALADAGDVGRAARVLGVAPDRLAAQLARLEDELGEPVFVRTPAGLSPTTRGRTVLARARAALVEMTELMAVAEQGGDTLLRLVGPSSMTTPVVARFAVSRPEIGVYARDVDAQLSLEALRADEADAAVAVAWPRCEWPVDPPDVELREFAAEPLQVVLPSTHRLAGTAGVVELGALARERWASRGRAESTQAVRAECVRHGFEPAVHYVVDSDEAVAALVASGRAVALSAPPHELHQGTVLRRYRGAGECRLAIAWRKGAVSPSAAQSLAAAAETWLRTRTWPRPGDVGRAGLGSAVRPLRIGSSAEPDTTELPGRLRILHGLQCTVRPGRAQDLLAAAVRGELDMLCLQVLAGVPPELPGQWDTIVVIEEQVRVQVVTPHPLAEAPLPGGELDGVAFTVRAESGELELVHDLAAALGITPVVTDTYRDGAEGLRQVATGECVRLVGPRDGGHPVTRLTVEHPAARRRLVLAWPAEQGAATLATVVAKELKAARLPAPGRYAVPER